MNWVLCWSTQDILERTHIDFIETQEVLLTDKLFFMFNYGIFICTVKLSTSFIVRNTVSWPPPPKKKTKQQQTNPKTITIYSKTRGSCKGTGYVKRLWSRSTNIKNGNVKCDLFNNIHFWVHCNTCKLHGVIESVWQLVSEQRSRNG